MIKILILESNPRGDLNLNNEIRDLQEAIQKSKHRDQFEVIPCLSVRTGDLHDLLLRHKPQIVHFCGHGNREQGLVFQGNQNSEQCVTIDALSDLFRLLKKDVQLKQNIQCVLLNACHSEKQAEAIAAHVDYVIGISQTIKDDAAIAFSKGFYCALGYGCSIEVAYEFGCNAIQLEITGNAKTRSEIPETQREFIVADVVRNTVIPDHLKPILKKQINLTVDGKDSKKQALTQETCFNIQLDIDKSLRVDPKENQYRNQVRDYLSDHHLAEHEKIFLEKLRQELGLSNQKSQQILEEELAPILEARQAYQHRLEELVQKGLYPFSREIQAELRKFQLERKLNDDEAYAIFQPIINKAQEKYKEETRNRDIEIKKRDYENKVQQYEQELKREIDIKFPLDEFANFRLQRLKEYLRLSDETVEQIEQSLIKKGNNQQKKRIPTKTSITIDYSKLANALNERDWKQADLETYHLLLQLTGDKNTDTLIKQHKVKFGSDFIEEVPCELLLKIDDLWKKYSQNRFGLSVQQSIWQELLQSNNQLESTNFYKFAIRIGWFKDSGKRWIPYNQFTFDLNAPDGHLPSLGYGLHNESLWRETWILNTQKLLRRFNLCLREINDR